MSEWYTKKISGYQIIKLKYEQFLMNRNRPNLFNVLSTTLLSDHTPNNETRTTFTCKKRGSLLVLIKTPHSYVYESDEQVRQILCSVGAVFVGALGRTIFFWDFYSSDYPLYKIVFDEEINVVGYGRWFIVKTKSGHVYMSDGSVYFVEHLRKENNLPFDSTEEKILDIACSYDHNLILTNKGKVYGYGRNGKCNFVVME